MTKDYDLRHKGTLHGTVHTDEDTGEIIELSVHLDIRTGELLKQPHDLVKVMGFYEVVLRECDHTRVGDICIHCGKEYNTYDTEE